MQVMVSFIPVGGSYTPASASSHYAMPPALAAFNL
jgi:hypothetical protein